ncbi:tRNA(Ile)-lysidine synthase [Williamsoniiplasma somnilux]|uniref:tRNA(Ile)-lysidine synthase n=1 Tax=Williamsoniiplasma somnilux TaxID=215578 RepID=A0A2K8P254_9MOLU|nr:tRNA lysidine(34) synthetase TilS [Williamsoniiplasma somnilux]ATZ19101.1 tRNA(Ile)-lysidine synthase [Williamsoniiplasma somnilux]
MININSNNNYLIGVSGGADSIFLLREVIKNKPKNLVVCHVNYNFRSDSNIDQSIVEKFCQENNLILEIKIVDTNFYQNMKENFEDWSRNLRYEFFVEMSKKYKINNLLIAHNKNDLVETFLIQEKRKALVSYFGLKKISNYKNLTVIRPLLNLTKSKILETLDRENVAYAIDSTNSDLKYLRNKIRSELKDNELDGYLQIIKEKNILLAEELQKAYFYANNNLTADELTLNQQINEYDIKMIQRIIFEYLKLINKETILQKRANNTSLEIAKRIKNSHKNFWSVNLGDQTLIKDYQKIYLLSVNNLRKESLIINSKDELHNLEEFINWLDLFNAIKKDQENYPYVVSNDYQIYQKNTFYNNKKTKDYFSEKKIPFKNRILKAVVYQKNHKKILNKIG